MTTEQWVVDGYNLSQIAHDIVTFDGLDDTPPTVGSNLGFAQTHGEKWVRKYFAAARKTLILYISSQNDDGSWQSTVDGKRANVDHRLDFLTALFGRRNKLLNVVRTLSDGSQRHASCECLVTIAPSTVGITDVKMGVELYIPSGFWEDPNTSNLLNASLPGSNLVVTGAAGATAPMTDCTYIITGPATNPRVTDDESGSYWQYNGTVPAGQQLIVSPDMTINSLAFDITKMVHVGEVNWLTLYPQVDAFTKTTKTTVTFTASSTTSATALTISGKRKFLR